MTPSLIRDPTPIACTETQTLFWDIVGGADKGTKNWVAVKELNLSYYIGETLLFTIYTHYGNFLSSLTATQKIVWLWEQDGAHRSSRVIGGLPTMCPSKWVLIMSSYAYMGGRLFMGSAIWVYFGPPGFSKDSGGRQRSCGCPLR